MNPLLLGGIFDVGSKLIDRLLPDPQQKAQAQLELMKMQQSGELSELSIRMSAIVAEANSPDPWTSRARPSFLYIVYGVILSLVVVAPVLGLFFPENMGQFFDNVGRGFAAIPEELWTTFAIGYCGYTGARSYEKAKGISR